MVTLKYSYGQNGNPTIERVRVKNNVKPVSVFHKILIYSL